LGKLTSTPFLVLFVLLGAVGVSTAYAVMTITLDADVKITGDTKLDGKLLDINNGAGTSGQVLSSTETGIDWIDAVGGPQGATGMTGMTGMDGFSQFTSVSRYVSSEITILSDTTQLLSLECLFPIPEWIISGGIEETNSQTEDFFIAESYPINLETWVTRVENNSPFSVTYKIWIVCLDFTTFSSFSSADVTSSEAKKVREVTELEPTPLSQPDKVR